MSDLCAAAPWPETCLDTLGRALESGDADRISSWVGNHVDEDDLFSWTAYAIGVASIGSDLIRRVATAQGVDIFAPAADPSLSQADRDAELLSTMVLNQDWAGVTGLMAGLEERGAVRDCCAALVGAATVALQFEAYLEGRVS